MRRLLCLLSAVTLLLGTSCGMFSAGGAENQAFSLYYPTRDQSGLREGALGTEQFSWAGEPKDAPLAALRRLRLSPEKAKLAPLFPPDIEVVSLHMERGVAAVALSDAYQQIAGYAKTLIEASVTLTLCQFEGVEGVRIGTASAFPADIFTAADFILDDLSLRPTERTLTLFFTDESGVYLLAQSRRILLRENEQAERYVIGELLAGPSRSSGLYTALPPGAFPLSVTTERGVCYVNCPRAFWENIPASAEKQHAILCSLVNSLLSVSESDIHSVQLLMDLVPREYYGAFFVREPLRLDTLSLVSEQQLDAGAAMGLYFPSPRGGIVGIPIRSIPREDATPEIEALETLFSQPAPLGLISPLPAGLTLQGLSWNERSFIVDLQYSGSPESLGDAFLCMTLTLTHRNPDMTVQFLINGAPLFDEPFSRDTARLLP